MVAVRSHTAKVLMWPRWSRVVSYEDDHTKECSTDGPCWHQEGGHRRGQTLDTLSAPTKSVVLKRSARAVWQPGPDIYVVYREDSVEAQPCVGLVHRVA